MSPRVMNSQGRSRNPPSRAAKRPAIALDVRVMTRTAAREEISHFETRSSVPHDSFETEGITRIAFFHIAGFMDSSCRSTSSRHVRQANLLIFDQFFFTES